MFCSFQSCSHMQIMLHIIFVIKSCQVSKHTFVTSCFHDSSLLFQILNMICFLSPMNEIFLIYWYGISFLTSSLCSCKQYLFQKSLFLYATLCVYHKLWMVNNFWSTILIELWAIITIHQGRQYSSICWLLLKMFGKN